MMKNVVILDDKVVKDNLGNAKFNLKIEKAKALGGKIIYELYVYRKEQEGISGCILSKIAADSRKNNTFKLVFDENITANNTITYTVGDGTQDKTFDVLGNDVMYSVKIKNEEKKILQEFDELMWLDTNYSQAKSTIIDVITDVIDTTERDDTIVGEERMSDVALIHMAIKGFFAEMTTNVDKVEF